jgi:hypothetical protein
MQRIMAFYVLYKLYSPEKTAIHPFLPAFLDGIDDEKSDPAERNFLCHLLFPASNAKDVSDTLICSIVLA